LRSTSVHPSRACSHQEGQGLPPPFGRSQCLQAASRAKDTVIILRITSRDCLAPGSSSTTKWWALFPSIPTIRNGVSRQEDIRLVTALPLAAEGRVDISWSGVLVESRGPDAFLDSEEVI
jgi:hypothetical protein